MHQIYFFYYITSTLQVSSPHWPIIRGVMAASLCHHLVHAVMWCVRAVAATATALPATARTHHNTA
jgi:hypothetical protein